MLSRIKIVCSLAVVNGLLRKKCPSRFVTSGEEGRKLDCYVIECYRQGEPYFLVRGKEDSRLVGLRWSKGKYNEDHSIPIRELASLELRVTHFYAWSRTTFDGVLDYLVNGASGISKTKIDFYLLFGNASQAVFNFKPMQRARRYQLLGHLVDLYLELGKPVNSLRLMERLYTEKWIMHPDANDQWDLVERHLELFEESKEIKRTDGKYRPTGKGYSTFADYENEERRFSAQKRLQRIAVILSLLVLALTAVQAGIVQLPTLLDLS